MKKNLLETKKIVSKVLSTSLFIGLAISYTSCSDDDKPPVAIDEEEVITTMTISLSAANAETVELQSRDLDGDGPNPPEITVANLAANTKYTGKIVLLNETVNPAEDITEEVKEEDDEHQFFFAIGGAISAATYEDEDDDGNPIGIDFTITTGEAGSGTLQITLRHEPKKPNDGSLVDAGGDTDIAQNFSLTVE